MQKNKDPQCLPLLGASNVRDLGGYINKDGIMLNYHKFVRAAKLDKLSDEDQAYLYAYGIRANLDLRAGSEVEEHPSSLRAYRQITYYNVPLLDNIHSDNLAGIYPDTMADMYIDLLKNSQASFRNIFMFFASNINEGTIFNCTAGKDRTGVVAMLLLQLADVSDETIVRDYSLSESYNTNIKEIQANVLKQYNILLPDFLFESKPKDMIETLQFFRNAYGDAKRYLSEIGVSNEEITLIKKALVE